MTVKCAFNYDKLNDFIERNCISLAKVSRVLGFKSPQPLYCKLNGEGYFTQNQIFMLMYHFKLTPEQVIEFFFTLDAKRED